MVSYASAAAFLPLLSALRVAPAAAIDISKAVPAGPEIVEIEGDTTVTTQALDCTSLTNDVSNMDALEVSYNGRSHIFGSCAVPHWAESQTSSSDISHMNCHSANGLSAISSSMTNPALYVKIAIDEADGCSETIIEKMSTMCTAKTITHDDRCEDAATGRRLIEEAIANGSMPSPPKSRIAEEYVDVLRGSVSQKQQNQRRLDNPTNPSPSLPALGTPTSPVIDVGFSFTKDVLCYVNGFGRGHDCDHTDQNLINTVCAKIKISLDEANEVLANSMLPLAFRMVDCDIVQMSNGMFVPDSYYDYKCLEEIRDFHYSSGGHLHHVNAVRANKGADMQVLVNYFRQASGGSCPGLGTQYGTSYIQCSNSPSDPTVCNPCGPTNPLNTFSVVPLQSLDQNDFVLAHELMHQLGALDVHSGVCYNTATGQATTVTRNPPDPYTSFWYDICSVMFPNGAKPPGRIVGILSGATYGVDDSPKALTGDTSCPSGGCQMWEDGHDLQNTAHCIKSNWDTVANYQAEVTGSCMSDANCDEGDRCLDNSCVPDCNLNGGPSSCTEGGPCSTATCNADGSCSYTRVAGCCEPACDQQSGASACTIDTCNADGVYPFPNTCDHTPIAGCCLSNADCNPDNCSPSYSLCVDNVCQAQTPTSCAYPQVCVTGNAQCVCDPTLGCCDNNDCAGSQTCDTDNTDPVFQYTCTCGTQGAPGCCVLDEDCNGASGFCSSNSEEYATATCTGGSCTFTTAACGSNAMCDEAQAGCCSTKKGTSCSINNDCCLPMTCETQNNGSKKCQQ